MNEPEIFQFMEIFRSVTKVFPLRGDDSELRDVGASYFKAMRRFSVLQVREGADRSIQQLKRFPKPAEWIDLIPRAVAAVPLQALSALEASEYLRAEAKHYDDDPCRCPLCRGAGVDHRLLRFVPEVDLNDGDARALLDDRIVTRGHWAHGEELARWYAARDGFWAKCDALGLRSRRDRAQAERVPFEQRLERLFSNLGRQKAAGGE